MKKIFIPLLVIALALALSAVYIVDQGTRAVVLRFNKVVTIAEPGLHFKLPLIETTRVIDARLKTTDSTSSRAGTQRFITQDKKDLLIDYYVQWKVTDFKRYYETVAGGYQLENILLDRLSTDLHTAISQHDMQTVINAAKSQQSSDKALLLDIKNVLNGKQLAGNPAATPLPLEQTQDSAKNSMQDFGIEVVDLQIKQISFPKEVADAIYQRMSAAQQVSAREQRFSGSREAQEIRAKANLRAAEIIATAEQQASAIRGEGDAQAAQLYAEAFKQDKTFFSFIRSLKTYQNSFGSSDVLVLGPESDFLRYMRLNKAN